MKPEAKKYESEKYFFYRIYLMDFEEVLKSIEILEGVKQSEIRFRLLRDIVVSYARPFSGNRGNLITSHQCPEKYIPKKYSDFHLELLKLRQERFAHSDLENYNPTIMRVKTKIGWGHPMAFTGIDYQKIDERITHLRELVMNVWTKVHDEIERMQRRFDHVTG